MKLYHGTSISGLKILRANSRDRAGNPVLYLTDHFSYSLFYIRDQEIDFVTCGVRAGGVVHYDEKFLDQLKILYGNRSGWVYEVDVDAEPTKTKGIYVVRGDASVSRIYAIPDVLQAIYDEIRKDKVHFLRFEDLTDEQLRLNREGMTRYFLSEQNLTTRKKQFLQEHFPEAWLDAQNILAQSR